MVDDRSSADDQRGCRRFRCHGQVIFSWIHRGEPRYGVAVNFGENGICIMTHRLMKVGTIIHLRLVGETAIDALSPMNPRSMALAEIKWCQTIDDAYSTTYCYGLKYLVEH